MSDKVKVRKVEYITSEEGGKPKEVESFFYVKETVAKIELAKARKQRSPGWKDAVEIVQEGQKKTSTKEEKEAYKELFESVKDLLNEDELHEFEPDKKWTITQYRNAKNLLTTLKKERNEAN